MALKLHDGTVLKRHLRDGFSMGPSHEFVVDAFGRLASGKDVEPCLMGTTQTNYRSYYVRFTLIAVLEKDRFSIEGVYDYSRNQDVGGSRQLQGKRIAFVYNSHSRISTHVYEEGDG